MREPNSKRLLLANQGFYFFFLNFRYDENFYIYHYAIFTVCLHRVFLMHLSATHICDFSFNQPITACSPLYLSATAHETDSAAVVERIWKLTTGATTVFASSSGSNAANFNYLISVSGSYCLSLYSRNANGDTCSIQKCNIVVYDKPVINFTFSPTSGCTPLLVNAFCNTTAGSGFIDSIVIDWGCGPPTFLNSCPVGPIQHLYNCPAGCYDIRVIVHNSMGCWADTTYQNAVCIADKPICTMTASPTAMCFEADSVCFQLSCANAFDRCHCDFGDGMSINFYTPNFCHVYQDTGVIHTCCVAYKDSCPSDTFCFAITVYPPIAKFLDSTFCAKGDTVFLYNKSVGATSVLWTFCNGDTSIAQNPWVVLPECDTCTVRLRTHSSSTGCDNQKTRIINTACSSASFTTMDTMGCSPFVVQYTNTSFSANSIFTRWDWDCSNGIGFIGPSGSPITHTFAAPGVYCIAMRNRSASGCIDTVYGTVSVCDITANFGPSTICSPAPYCPVDSSIDSSCGITNWQWDFGDGTIETGQTPCHQYTTAGIYIVKLVVTNANGCSDSVLKSVEFTLIANFNYTQSGDTILFHNLSSGVFQTTEWDFGDGTNSSSFSPVHLYSTEDTFNVVLTVSDTVEGCYNDFSQTIVIAHPQSVNEITEAYSIRVIPNPFSNYILLKIEGGNTTGAEIRIADLLGNLVRSIKTDASGIAKIERENLANGMYIYEVRLHGKRIGNGKMIAQ
ncbi:MAG: PKD domain-containing protein [Bacteroidetes bacterium]|nr:PKD domain-containing protein [Bacteroidota bacterium]